MSDPDELVAQAVANAREIDSYYMEFAFSPEGTDIPVYVDYAHDRYYERIEGPGEDGTFEIVTADGYLYTRCDYDEHCLDWTRKEFEFIVPSMGGLTTTMPETLGLTALDLGHSWEVVSTDGAIVTLRGAVHPVEMIDENRRFNGLRAGLSEEEILLANEEQHEGDPAAIPNVIIEAEIDRDEVLPLTVRVITPPELSDTGEQDLYFYTEYSNFDDVSVAIPEEFDVFDICDLELPTDSSDQDLEYFHTPICTPGSQ